MLAHHLEMHCQRGIHLSLAVPSVWKLTSLGIAFERQEVGGQFGSDGWNILAKVPGEGAPILLSSHMDTVSPGVDIKPSVKDGVIYSDGSTVLGADDKAGIAAALEAVETIMESGSRHR